MTAGLLEKESTGGATAREGFEYQDAFVLQYLPLWLSQSAFSHVVSEAIGDVEVCYFAPSGGTRRVMYEAKDYALSSTDFWQEIKRFRTVFQTSSEEYVRFGLVCRDYNNVTSPLLSKLERLRGVGTSYQSDSVFLAGARQEIVKWCEGKGCAYDLAEFVIEHVDFVRFSAENSDSAFSGEVEKHLPWIDLAGSQIRNLRGLLKVSIARSSFGPLCRKDIEETICEVLGSDKVLWLSTPITVQTEKGEASVEKLGVSVGGFNGPERGTKTESDWSSLFSEALSIGAFLHKSTARRCVSLDSKQRMSMACLLGYAFSATRGFVLEIEHNGLRYRTDAHEKTGSTFFTLEKSAGESGSSEGIACISFPTPIGADVKASSLVALANLARVTLDSTNAIDGIEALNQAVNEAKYALVQYRSDYELSTLHLFLKTPSVFSMVLGHRLNGVCDIQLYDWVDGNYVPTALLKS
jgi:hypothetical protein